MKVKITWQTTTVEEYSAVVELDKLTELLGEDIAEGDFSDLTGECWGALDSFLAGHQIAPDSSSVTDRSVGSVVKVSDGS